MIEDRSAKGRDAILQTLAWCSMKPRASQPHDLYANYVVIGTSQSAVKLLDISKNKVVSKFTIPSSREDIIFSLDWNKDGLLAVGSTSTV